MPPLVFAQSSARTFEAAAIKLHDAPLKRINDITTSGQRLTGYAANVGYLITYAYNLKDFQLAGTQDDSTYWNVFAKGDGDSIPTRAEFRRMLQSAPGDARDARLCLSRGQKNGPRLEDADPDAAPGLFNQEDHTVVTLPKASMPHRR